jgi:two-component system cell cycle sensor histidine kinase/response regulator CckA
MVTKQTFVLKLDSEVGLATGRVQGHVEDVQTGEAVRFSYVADLLAFLQKTMKQNNDRESTENAPESSGDDCQRREERKEGTQRAEGQEAVASVAHDLKNIFLIVNGYCHCLLAGLSERDPSHASVLQITHAVERGNALVQRLLTMGRYTGSQARSLDINCVVEQTGQLLEPVLGKNLQLRTSLASDAGRVQADLELIERIIMNLVINARDAMPDGGEITLATGKAYLDGQQGEGIRPGCYVTLSVKDTGIGMDRDTLDNIFKPFFTTRSANGGTGLGLATVHESVRQTGGHIAIESEQGRGTTFIVYLPPARPTAVPALPERETEGAGGSEKILLVDDNPEVCSLVREILSQQGYEVVVAEGPGQALKLVGSGMTGIQLLLTDLLMPETSGPALARAFHQLQPNLPVVYMSGNDGQGKEYLDENSAFIMKPFSSKDLAQTIRRTLDRAMDSRRVEDGAW